MDQMMTGDQLLDEMKQSAVQVSEPWQQFEKMKQKADQVVEQHIVNSPGDRGTLTTNIKEDGAQQEIRCEVHCRPALDLDLPNRCLLRT
ncbi:hypothetical protein ACHWQZ_G009595 [Mnemiopsis leidyi]